MTRLLLALCATASIATLGSASAASADPSGFVSIGAGPIHIVNDFGFGTFTEDGYAVEGLASGVYQFTPVLGVQGDIVLGFDHFEDEFGGEYDRKSIDVALHGFYREPDKFLIGTFAQLGRDAFSFPGFDDDYMNRVYFGGEAQVFVDDLTLYVQGGIQQFSFVDGPGSDLNGHFGSIEARYFLTPDFRIEAHAGVSDVTQNVGIDLTTTTLNLGLGAEYRLENLPFSVFASYDFYNSTYNLIPDLSTDHHRFMVGAKFGIGEDTLKDRDRNGTSLEPVDTTAIMSGSIG